MLKISVLGIELVTDIIYCSKGYKRCSLCLSNSSQINFPANSKGKWLKKEVDREE